MALKTGMLFLTLPSIFSPIKLARATSETNGAKLQNEKLKVNTEKSRILKWNKTQKIMKQTQEPE